MCGNDKHDDLGVEASRKVYYFQHHILAIDIEKL